MRILSAVGRTRRAELMIVILLLNRLLPICRRRRGVLVQIQSLGVTSHSTPSLRLRVFFPCRAADLRRGFVLTAGISGTDSERARYFSAGRSSRNGVIETQRFINAQRSVPSTSSASGLTVNQKI